MMRATVELAWELVTGEGVVRVSGDTVDAAAHWGLHDAHEPRPDERDFFDGDLRVDELF